MSQHIQQVVSVPTGQVVQGQLVQGQVVTGGQVTTAQMVMSSTANLTAIPQQQIITGTQLVSGQTVQGTIATNSIGTTSLTAGQHSQTASNVTQIKQPQTQSVPPLASSVPISDNPPPVVSKQRMSELVREIDPSEQLDEDVEELLMTIADDFIESTVNAACKLAKHRGSRTLEVKDVQMYLERNWHMWIPGFGTDELKPYKRAPTTEAHKQRLALLRKAVKKY